MERMGGRRLLSRPEEQENDECRMTNDEEGEDAERATPNWNRGPAYAKALRRGGQRSETKTIIIFMRSYPKPHNQIVFAQAKRAIIITNPNDTDFVSSLFEGQRWMERISSP
jgi:hypothetical protein